MAPHLFCYSNVPPAAAGPSWISTLYMRHSVFGVYVYLEPANQMFSQTENVTAMHFYWEKEMYGH